MLEIENLKTNFNTYDGVVKALDGVNLKIEDGEIFGLVGETGSGKSVTCYSALKLLPKAGEVVDGTIKLNGEDITNANDERLREIRGGEIGIIFQDPLSALNPVMTVNEQIGEILVLHQNAELQKLALEKEIPTFKSEKWKASPGVEFTIMAFCISFISLFVMLGQWRFSLPFLFVIMLMFLRDYLQRDNPASALDLMVIDALSRVKLPNPEQIANSYPHELSGGMQQRVMIAMALAGKAKMLIADEPTTALDVTIQAQILDLLANLKKEFGMSMLFITHDLNIVRQIADRVCVMNAGKIVEQGDTDSVFEKPKNEYTKKLLKAVSSSVPKSVSAHSKIILSAQDTKVWFPVYKGFLKRTVGHIKALNSATFDVRMGETLGIVGESGSGKSTIALALMRLIDFEGEINFDGKDIGSLKTRELRRIRSDMQIVFQDPFGSLSPRMTCAQIISEGLEVHQSESSDDIQLLVEDVMNEVGLDPVFKNRYPHEFSGGQRQRIAIARAMVLKPKLVILDEPTSALDRTVQFQIVKLLKQLQEKYGLAYIFISHDLAVIRAMSHRVLVMKLGDIVESGHTGKSFQDPKEPYTRDLLIAAKS